MASYHCVSSRFLAATRSWPPEERDAALGLQIWEHRRTEGLFRAPAAVVAWDLGWEPGRLDAALDDLVGRGWLARDGDWVCIVDALEHDFNRPVSPSAIRGALRKVDDAPRGGDAWAAFQAGAERWCPGGLGGVLAGRLTVETGPNNRGLVLVATGAPANSDHPSTTPVAEGDRGSADRFIASFVTPTRDERAATTPVLPLPPCSTSNSNSSSISPLPAADDEIARGRAGRQGENDRIAALLDQISAAARRGPSQLLRAQADDPSELADVRAQLELAGVGAGPAAGHVVEWLSRPGEALKAKRISGLVRSAAAKVPSGLFIATSEDADTTVFARRPELAGISRRVAERVAASGVAESERELWLLPLAVVAAEGRSVTLAGPAHLMARREVLLPVLERALAPLSVELVAGDTTDCLTLAAALATANEAEEAPCP